MDDTLCLNIYSCRGTKRVFDGPLKILLHLDTLGQNQTEKHVLREAPISEIQVFKREPGNNPDVCVAQLLALAIWRVNVLKRCRVVNLTIMPFVAPCLEPPAMRRRYALARSLRVA